MNPHQVNEGVLDRPPATKAAELTSTSEANRARSVAILGMVLSLAGVVLYCVASFRSEDTSDLSAVLFQFANPAALSALGIMGVGTLLWMFGSIMHLHALMDADEELVDAQK
ncbi:MAG: hypothetical protein IT462_14425 [Planctomycetes bacterium]|nr:hypothetical protein [Planctomycetota bacterium]